MNDVARPDVNAGGHALLKVKVTAVAEGGKANKVVIKLLAKRWKTAPGRFSLVSGAASRLKTIDIVEADQALLDKILTIEETESR